MRWVIAIVGIVLGAILGLGYGWTVNPATFSDASPPFLRIDYRTDYVLMVAEAYGSRQDLEFARRQLAVLGNDPPAMLCEQSVKEARRGGYSTADVGLLQALLRGMLTNAAAPTPAGEPP
jgi:hypothetical protein